MQRPASPFWLGFAARHSVLIFSLLTLALTYGIALLPMPLLLIPMLVVIVPTLVAVGLISLTGCFRQVRPGSARAVPLGPA